ncbi:MAG TPA: hypothetical protein VGO61_21900 [Steroidobacteraceae bacterium]|jgi:hypothetical protein|nr:hypothetical protein [Steroidobacteraceae bacterium]
MVTIIAGYCVGLGIVLVMGSVGGTVVSCIAFIVVGAVGIPVVRGAASRWLYRRDALAEELNETEVAHDEAGVLLLLHSFTRPADQVIEYHERETGKGTTYGPLPYYSYPEQGSRFFDRRIHNDLFWDIDEAAIGLARLVRLGGRSVHRHSSSSLCLEVGDEVWFEAMKRAAEIARLIVFIPERSESLLQELTELRDSGWYAKTIVVMQPEREFGDEGTKRADAWKSYREQLSQQGFDLPEYDPAGLFYLPSRDFSIAHLLTTDLRSTVPERLRESLATALLRTGDRHVCACHAVPYILHGERGGGPPPKRDPDIEASQSKHNFETLPALFNLYADPPVFFAFMRRKAGLEVFSLLSIVLLLVAIIAWTSQPWMDFVHQVWIYAREPFAISFGVLAACFVVSVIAAAFGVPAIVAFAIGFLGPCVFWLFLLTGFVGHLPSGRDGVLMGSAAGFLLGSLLAWARCLPSLRAAVSHLLLWMPIILVLAGLIGVGGKYVDGGVPRALPSIAFGALLLAGLFRPYNWLLHALILMLPARRGLLLLHPACWDKVCELPYPGLEYLLGRFALKDWPRGLAVIRRVAQHRPLRRAAARAEQAVYVARAAEVEVKWRAS